MAGLSNWLTRHPLVFILYPNMITFILWKNTFSLHLSYLIYKHKVQRKHLHHYVTLYIYIRMSHSFTVRNVSFHLFIRCIFVFFLGYTCQGNEWSLYMLFASHFILNRLALICILNTSDCIIPLAYQKPKPFRRPKWNGVCLHLNHC